MRLILNSQLIIILLLASCWVNLDVDIHLLWLTESTTLSELLSLPELRALSKLRSLPELRLLIRNIVTRNWLFLNLRAKKMTSRINLICAEPVLFSESYNIVIHFPGIGHWILEELFEFWIDSLKHWGITVSGSKVKLHQLIELLNGL